MPRCTISVSPPDRSARMYFDRRRSRSTRWPESRSAMRSGNGQRRSGRFTWAVSITAPSIAGASPRRTVSTSGNSGIGSFFRTLRAICRHALSRHHGGTGQDPATEQTTHFGYQTVREEEKAGRVRGVFTSVASRYDVMNDVMSVGIHRLWKDAMMDWLAPRPGQKLLDVAGGTGDVSFRFLGRAGHGHATVCDLTESMLVEGRKRAEAERLEDSLDWVAGDAMALPFPDNSFDVYTISFGIRNVTRPQKALDEAFRVLRPGGRLMVLEFSQIPNEMMQKVYDLYSFNVIPAMGQLIANDRDSYQYLVESIRRFPDQETFLGMVEAAGFEQAKYRNLSMGIACLHSGWKL
ncbi:LOW QUALITY PROTEIN: ubiquinone/menaquinone biosynthesis methyltransferase ubiE [Limimaricola cinnabarinus LL-001]|uniref:Ubiquinone/menaquinone biosynthesis C-methyltransferase UbiE n=1 Tax=Limimaricola cinnabarinus LL-001 TaxID=1337093 RepID=U2Z4F2_9RHOB|nr:LOW QUALITY PROTEIN: ubiquinone/menaquinone biosynthesis methyltransferase ubiE [Limimaricola cinnabarinus LL-001]